MFDLSFVAGMLPYALLLVAGGVLPLGVKFVLSGLQRRNVNQLKPAIPRVESSATPGVYELFNDTPQVQPPSRSTPPVSSALTVAQKIKQRVETMNAPSVTTPGAASVLAPGSNLVTPPTTPDVRTIVTAPLTSAIVSRRQKYGWGPPPVVRPQPQPRRRVIGLFARLR